MGANPAYTPIELNHLFKTSDVKFVIVEPDLLSKILPTVHETGVSLENVRLLELGELQGAAPFVSWTSLLEHGEEEWVAFDDEFKAKATIAALMSTSGTTGLPKAAEISHYALVSQSVMLYDSKEKPYEVSWVDVNYRSDLFMIIGQTTPLSSSIPCLCGAVVTSCSFERGTQNLHHEKIPSRNICSLP